MLLAPDSKLTAVNFLGGTTMRCLSFTAFAIALALPIGISEQSASKGTNVSRNYYIEAQASRGKQQYAQFCFHCYMPNLKGAGRAAALVGGDFLRDFDGVQHLYIKVIFKMPDDN